jgi:hypothetical protein
MSVADPRIYSARDNEILDGPQSIDFPPLTVSREGRTQTAPVDAEFTLK